MSFRNFLYQQILPLVKNNRENINYHNLKTEVFFFQIGCYPSSLENLHHECHPFLLDCQKNNVNVNLICIDPLYANFLENTEVRNRISDFSFPTFIYDNIIDEDNYICLVEFCHFISNFSCLSIINEYTGYERKPFFQTEHQTPYLYISPSSCQIEKTDHLSQPLLKLDVQDKLLPSGEMVKISIYTWQTFRKLEKLYEELDFSDIKKLNHIKSIIQYQCSRITTIYVRLLNLLDLDEFRSIRSRLDDNSKYKSMISKLLDKFSYDKHEVQNLITSFEESQYNSFSVYLKKQISYIMIAALHCKYRRNIELIQKYNSYLIFETTTDILYNLQFLVE